MSFQVTGVGLEWCNKVFLSGKKSFGEGSREPTKGCRGGGYDVLKKKLWLGVWEGKIWLPEKELGKNLEHPLKNFRGSIRGKSTRTSQCRKNLPQSKGNVFGNPFGAQKQKSSSCEGGVASFGVCECGKEEEFGANTHRIQGVFPSHKKAVWFFGELGGNFGELRWRPPWLLKSEKKGDSCTQHFPQLKTGISQSSGLV